VIAIAVDEKTKTSVDQYVLQSDFDYILLVIVLELFLPRSVDTESINFFSIFIKNV
jgi:hypothetical protein